MRRHEEPELPPQKYQTFILLPVKQSLMYTGDYGPRQVLFLAVGPP